MWTVYWLVKAKTICGMELFLSSPNTGGEEGRGSIRNLMVSKEKNCLILNTKLFWFPKLTVLSDHVAREIKSYMEQLYIGSRKPIFSKLSL